MDLVQESISKFVDELLKQKGVSNLDAEVVNQMKSDLMERLENKINALILSKIPADKLEEFEKLLDSGSDSEVQEFVKSNVENLETLLATELVNFQKLYIG